ncbi:hypothetical protein KIPB_012861, partial [Kipferlia bialata]|eukprot:g12861.t1
MSERQANLLSSVGMCFHEGVLLFALGAWLYRYHMDSERWDCEHIFPPGKYGQDYDGS